MARKLLWSLGIVVALLVLVAVLLSVLIDKDKVLAIASAKLEEQTGARLTVSGPVELALFPRLRLDMSDVMVTTAEGGMTLQAGSLGTGIALLPVLRGAVEIDTVHLRDLLITTVAPTAAEAEAAKTSTLGLSNAELDVLYAARKQARQLARENNSAGAALALPLALNVGRLSVANATLRTVNKAGKTLSDVILVELTATDLNVDGRPVPLNMLLTIPGTAGAQAIDVAIAGEVLPALQQQLVTLPGLSVTVTGVTVNPLTAELSGQMTLGDQVANLDVSFSVEDTKGSGKLRYSAFDSPQIDATLDMNAFSPALLALAGPEAAAQGSGEPEATDPAAPLPYDALRSIDTSAQLTIGEVSFGPHRLTGVRAALRALNGKINLEQVSGTVHEGAINLNAELNARYAPATFTSTGGVTGLDLASAIAVMESSVQASGKAGLSWELRSRGSSSQELTEALSGPIKLRTEAVTVKGVSAERSLCAAVALAHKEALTATFPSDTVFTALAADINVDAGKARLEPLTALLPAVAIGGTGNLDLESRDFRTEFKAQLQAGLAELDPACRIDARLADVRWPLVCRGNLAGKPGDWCKVDTAGLLKGLAADEVKKEAGKLLKKLFD